MLSPDSLAQLVKGIERGNRRQYLEGHSIEVECCIGPFGYHGSTYNICLITLDHEEPYLLIYYPEYDPLLEMSPRLEKIYP